jgi:hypothetical protein
VKVAADAIAPVRVYVAAPPGTKEGDIAFVMTAMDKEGGHDRVETRFDAPEDEHADEHGEGDER